MPLAGHDRRDFQMEFNVPISTPMPLAGHDCVRIALLIA